MKKSAVLSALAATVTLGFASNALAITPVPSSTETYQFTGQCTDCTGFGTATLTLQNYTAGTPLQDSNLVDFTYSSNLVSFEINPVDDFLSYDSLSGSLGSTTGSYDVSVATNFLDTFGGYYFNSHADGTWEVGNNIFLPPADVGTNGTWNVSAAPEPSTWALMFIGVAGLGAALRLSRRRPAVAAA